MYLLIVVLTWFLWGLNSVNNKNIDGTEQMTITEKGKMENLIEEHHQVKSRALDFLICQFQKY